MKTRKMMATEEDRLSDLPDSVRLHILSLLPEREEIVRSSILSKQWRFLWKSVPISLSYCSERSGHFVDCLNRELLVSKSFQKIQKFSVNFRNEMCLRLRNVASLVTVVLDFEPHFWFDDYDDGDGGEDDLDKEYRYLKELLQSLVHVKNLALGPWCIESLSILVLKGWQSPASSRKLLTLNAALVQQDFPAICSLLQSSSDLETLVIDWSNLKSRDSLSRFVDEDENGRTFEKHVFNSSLLHLRTIKIINFYGPLRENKFIMPLVKHLLKNAEVLEKMVIASSLCSNKFQGSDVSQDFVDMAQEFLSFPRSSKQAVVVFSY